LVQKSVLLKVSETPSLKLAPGASAPPDVGVVPDVVVLGVLPHAARTGKMKVTNAMKVNIRANGRDIAISFLLVDKDRGNTEYFLQ